MTTIIHLLRIFNANNYITTYFLNGNNYRLNHGNMLIYTLQYKNPSNKLSSKITLPSYQKDDIFSTRILQYIVSSILSFFRPILLQLKIEYMYPAGGGEEAYGKKR